MTVSAADIDGVSAFFVVVDGVELATSVVDGAVGRLIGDRCDAIAPDLMFAVSLAAPKLELPLPPQDASANAPVIVNIAARSLGTVLNQVTLADLERRIL